MRILLGTPDPALEVLVRDATARFGFSFETARDGLDAFHLLAREPFDLAILDFELPPGDAADLLRRLDGREGPARPPAIVLTRTGSQRADVESAGLDAVEALPAPVPPRLLAERITRALGRRLRVACLGGGTGLFTLLSGLKTIPGLSLSAIVTMGDDGGSTGRLRDRFGILPPGDVRRSLVALSTAPDLLNRLLQYRFVRGRELRGHNLGNLVLTALAEMRGSLAAAVAALGEILSVKGEVIPVTAGSTRLVARLRNGAVLTGESTIDAYEAADASARIDRLWCDPPVAADPSALRALGEADLIVLGPGDLFTSVIANLVVEGVAAAVRESRAARVFVVNVMTEPGETAGFSVADHVREVLRYLGADCLDRVLCSSTRLAGPALEAYARRGQAPVEEREGERLSDLTRARIVRADVASESELVRHDSLKLAAAMRGILEEAGAEPRVSVPAKTG